MIGKKKKKKPFQLKALLVGFAGNQHAGRRSTVVLPPLEHRLSATLLLLLWYGLITSQKQPHPGHMGCAFVMMPLLLQGSNEFLQFIYMWYLRLSYCHSHVCCSYSTCVTLCTCACTTPQQLSGSHSNATTVQVTAFQNQLFEGKTSAALGAQAPLQYGMCSRDTGHLVHAARLVQRLSTQMCCNTAHRKNALGMGTTSGQITEWIINTKIT